MKTFTIPSSLSNVLFAIVSVKPYLAIFSTIQRVIQVYTKTPQIRNYFSEEGSEEFLKVQIIENFALMVTFDISNVQMALIGVSLHLELYRKI